MKKGYIVAPIILMTGIILYFVVPDYHSSFCASLPNTDGIKACDGPVNSDKKVFIVAPALVAGVMLLITHFGDKVIVNYPRL